MPASFPKCHGPLTPARSFICAAYLLAVLLVTAQAASAIEIAIPPLAKEIKNPESVAVGPDGRVFCSVIGEFDKDGDGQVITVTAGNKKEVIADGLDDPKGIAFFQDWLFVADKTRVVRLDRKGKVEIFASSGEFPREPKFLNDIAVDSDGNVYVSDSGDLKGKEGAVFRITPDRKISILVDGHKETSIQTPNGLLIDGPKHILMTDFAAGLIYRVSVADGKLEKIAEGFPGADGLARDYDGNLYVSSWLKGSLWVLPGGKEPEELISDKYQSAADICINYATGHVLVPDMKAGTVSTTPIRSGVPKVDTSELPVKIETAFEKLTFERPVILTHAGDGSNRVFVASQYGKVFVFDNDQAVTEPQVFFDLTSKVLYKDNENEQGLLGLAFHPKFKENGQFFVYYSTKDTSFTTVVSRFTSKDGKTADKSSEEELLRIPQPFWNHKGGTIVFGPDGYLYIGMGDGGAANDPYKNGQNMSKLLGKLLRIDVDSKSVGKPYGIPKDNPFVGDKSAQPEIFATGFRNIWRMSFDRQTKAFWVADVGQNLWEEINVVTRGGNYGWNPREGMHSFTANGSQPSKEFIEPIWEYHHDIGKSVTGGHVYRGKKVPALAGMYLYADYVTGKVWALEYDSAKNQATANHRIESGSSLPVMSFGEGEDGEIYFMTTQGKLHKFASAGKK